jgi:predicted ABC-type ATPase
MKSLADARLWMVAGPNGAGKTTTVSKEPIAKILPAVTFLNPDERSLRKLRAAGYGGFGDAPLEVQSRFFIESADEVFEELSRRLHQGEAMGVETALSSAKYCSLVEELTRSGGFFALVYVALGTPALARERVDIRVRHGGHDIPEDRIAARW